MPVKCIKKKVLTQPVNNAQIISHLHNLRTKVRLPRNDPMHQNLIRYVRSLNYEYNTPEEDEINKNRFIETNNIKVGDKLRIEVPVVNEKFEHEERDIVDVVNHFKTEMNIITSEIKCASLCIYPPANAVSSYVNTIERMPIKTGSRVIIFLCSDELVHYKMLDMKGASQVFGMPSGSEEQIEIPEYVERGSAYCFNQLSGLSLSVKFNNEEKYLVKKRERSELKQKLPKSRFIVVIDYEYTPETTKKKVVEYVDTIKGISDDTKQNTKTTSEKKTFAKAAKLIEKNKANRFLNELCTEMNDEKMPEEISFSREQMELLHRWREREHGPNTNEETKTQTDDINAKNEAQYNRISDMF